MLQNRWHKPGTTTQSSENADKSRLTRCGRRRLTDSKDRDPPPISSVHSINKGRNGMAAGENNTCYFPGIWQLRDQCHDLHHGQAGRCNAASGEGDGIAPRIDGWTYVQDHLCHFATISNQIACDF
jgi:hypothetical protein